MSTVREVLRPARKLRSGGGAGLGPPRAVALRSFRDVRTLTIGFVYLFGVYSYIQPAGYRHTYSTLASRLAFAHSFASNSALRLIYGQPRAVQTVAGYTAWRVGGTLAIAAAIYGWLVAVRALRAEEAVGRTELVLAGIIGRPTAYLSTVTAVAASAAILWVAEFLGFVAGGLPAAGSAYLALATMTVIPVLAGVGAVASQVAPTSRIAHELTGATFAAFVLLRGVADTAHGVGWLDWATPLGWAEQLRPFGGSRPIVLLLPLAATVTLVWAAGRLIRVRDIGSGLLPVADRAEPRFRLLSSPTAQALRSQRDSLAAWAGGVALFGFILGVVSGSVSSAGLSKNIIKQFAKLGAGSIATPRGYLAFVFTIFIVTVSLLACAQIGAARREEADQRLETVLALPASRTGWLGGRLILASVVIAVISLTSGFFTWAGAVTGAVSISLSSMLEAGANCIPVALIFLGLAALAYALARRASGALTYGVVTAAYLWQTVSALAGAPRWIIDVSPFAHVGLVPTQPFGTVSATVMIGIAVVAVVMSLRVFRRRDVLGA